MASVPTGAHLPTGTTLVVALDPQTRQVTDLGLSDRNVTIPGLQPFELTGNTPPPSASSSDVSGEALRIPGVPFKVCRPMTIGGTFGAGLDTVWVFEEERVPDAGCVGSEGFQRLGVGTADGVQVLSERITDMVGDDSYKVIPYATPDLNGDGQDEIALAKPSQDGTSVTVWFFQVVAGGKVLPILLDCGPACDPAPISFSIAPVEDRTTAAVQSGISCDSSTDAGPGLLVWSSAPDDPLRLVETRYGFEGGVLLHRSTRDVRVTSVADYPQSGLGELCGGATSDLSPPG
jgi:hypothetical protein